MADININFSKGTQNTKITVNGSQFVVLNHWFWDQFANQWEPQTISFFTRNLEQDGQYLDIGGWIGPTAFIATALGAGKIKIVEPNPMSYFHLLAAQLNNRLLDKWLLINACVSDKKGHTTIGPIEGIAGASSATNIRDVNQTGASVISLRLEDLIFDNEDPSLVKIDIEGAEASIVHDLPIFSSKRSAIWLSIHPPFMDDKRRFSNDLLALGSDFYFVDENNRIISDDILSARIQSEDVRPHWGTQYGNFFEIGLLPKNSFNRSGLRRR
jgi:FkbM family methyltransferase